jgi:Tfp pilus assembly protein PilV
MKSEKGQSLFEVVVAIAISALIVVTLVSVTSNSIQNSSFSKNKSLAATYADQASEWIRSQRDTNIDILVTKATNGGTFCLPDLSSWPASASDVASCTAISNTPFTRSVSLGVYSDLSSGKNVISSDVLVTWQDSQGMHEVADDTTLVDLRQR